jgi:FkbM family methyltransferase
MELIAPPARPFSLARCLGKFGLFSARGYRPALAWRLACTDAPKRHDYRSASVAALDSAARADPSWKDITVTGGQMQSVALGLEFQRDDLVSRGYHVWMALAQLGWKFSRDTSGGLLARRGSLTLMLSTDEEREMISEIFLAGCYDWQLAGDWQVIDIGANVGMAALFFAGQPWVKNVISFEPFDPTADAFERNVGSNPHLSAKIRLVRQALADSNTTLSVDYHPALRGSMALTGVGTWRGRVDGAVEKISIDVCRAREALAPIIAARGASRLLAKLDCEGSEYPIFEELEASGQLTEFSAFVIEWHGRGPDEIVQRLQRHGYAVHLTPLAPDQRTLGLIYATRLAPDRSA